MSDVRRWTLKYDKEFQYLDGVPAELIVAHGPEIGDYERVEVVEARALDELENHIGEHGCGIVQVTKERDSLREKLAVAREALGAVTAIGCFHCYPEARAALAKIDGKVE